MLLRYRLSLFVRQGLSVGVRALRLLRPLPPMACAAGSFAFSVLVQRIGEAVVRDATAGQTLGQAPVVWMRERLKWSEVAGT